MCEDKDYREYLSVKYKRDKSQRSVQTERLKVADLQDGLALIDKEIVAIQEKKSNLQNIIYQKNTKKAQRIMQKLKKVEDKILILSIGRGRKELLNKMSIVLFLIMSVLVLLLTFLGCSISFATISSLIAKGCVIGLIIGSAIVGDIFIKFYTETALFRDKLLSKMLKGCIKKQKSLTRKKTKLLSKNKKYPISREMRELLLKEIKDCDNLLEELKEKRTEEKRKLKHELSILKEYEEEFNLLNLKCEALINILNISLSEDEVTINDNQKEVQKVLRPTNNRSKRVTK